MRSEIIFQYFFISNWNIIIVIFTSTFNKKLKMNPVNNLITKLKKILSFNNEIQPSKLSPTPTDYKSK